MSQRAFIITRVLFLVFLIVWVTMQILEVRDEKPLAGEEVVERQFVRRGGALAREPS